MSLKHINTLVARLVSEILEEDTSSEERYLNCVDVDVGFVSVPGNGTDYIGHQEAEHTVEEEEEEEDDDNDDDEFEEEDPDF